LKSTPARTAEAACEWSAARGGHVSAAGVAGADNAVRHKLPKPAMSKQCGQINVPERGDSVAMGYARSSGSRVRHSELALASLADEAADGFCEGLGKCSPVCTARQRRILTGAERHLNLTLPRHIQTHRHRRRCQLPARRLSPTGLSAAMYVSLVPQVSAWRQINAIR
jgi:hypothetical protein